MDDWEEKITVQIKIHNRGWMATENKEAFASV